MKEGKVDLRSFWLLISLVTGFVFMMVVIFSLLKVPPHKFRFTICGRNKEGLEACYETDDYRRSYECIEFAEGNDQRRVTNLCGYYITIEEHK